MPTRTDLKSPLIGVGPRASQYLTFALALLAAAGVATCSGDDTGPVEPPPPPPNRAPTAVGSIAPLTVTAGETVTTDVASYFGDPDGDALTYSATTSNAATASPTIAGSSLTVAGVSPGTATVTVTARDPGGLTATQSAAVTVARRNQPPVVVGTIPPPTVVAGETVTVALSEYFSDPDGDTLTYAASTSDPAIASPTTSEGTLTIAGVAPGTATVTIVARDPGGLSVQQSTAVTVASRITAVTVSPAADTIVTGDTLRLTARAVDAAGQTVTTAVVSWVSSDTSVAEVDASGLVRGVSEGVATVSAAAGSARGTAEIRVFSPDRAALVALYRATSGENWSSSDNWLTDLPLEDWHGVSMNTGGRVRSLDLFINGLAGPIPPDIGALTKLEALFLAGNNLTGRIPQDIAKLIELGTLSLHANNLTGEIPPDIGTLTNLEELLLNHNNLTGPIPPQLGNLLELETLNLGANALTGPIPLELGKLGNLVNLQLYENDLTGSIPPELGHLLELETLALIQNALTGPIPPELGNLINLRTLILADNALTGPIPPELGNLIELTHLWLQGIALTGPIPLELRNLTALQSFLYHNTSLCVPDDDSFRTWLNNIPDHQGTGVDCKASSGFRDDFSSSASLSNWTLWGASASISDGALSLTQDSTTCASAVRDHDGKGWDVKELRMRASSPESIGLVSLRFNVDSTTKFDALFGNVPGVFSTNNFYFRRDNVIQERGYFSAIDVAPREFIDFSLSVDQGVIMVHVGDQLIFRTAEFGSPRIVSYGMSVCSTTSDRHRSGLFDWYEANSSRSSVGAELPMERIESVRDSPIRQDVELRRISLSDQPMGRVKRPMI